MEMLAVESIFWFEEVVPQLPGLGLDRVQHGWEIAIGDSWQMIAVEIEDEIGTTPTFVFHLILVRVVIVGGGIEAAVGRHLHHVVEKIIRPAETAMPLRRSIIKTREHPLTRAQSGRHPHLGQWASSIVLAELERIA